MAITDLFSKRQKRLRGEVSDIYTYDNIPQNLRVQIVHILKDAIGSDLYGTQAADGYEYFNETLCREYGIFKLGDSYRMRHFSTRKDLTV